VKRRLYPTWISIPGLFTKGDRHAGGYVSSTVSRVPRTSGWLAQWVELLEDKIRNRSPATDLFGQRTRDYVPMEQRKTAGAPPGLLIECWSSRSVKRV